MIQNGWIWGVWGNMNTERRFGFTIKSRVFPITDLNMFHCKTKLRLDFYRYIYHIISYYIILYHIILYIILYHIILYIILYCIIVYYVRLYIIISYYIILYHIILHYLQIHIHILHICVFCDVWNARSRLLETLKAEGTTVLESHPGTTQVFVSFRQKDRKGGRKIGVNWILDNLSIFIISFIDVNWILSYL